MWGPAAPFVGNLKQAKFCTFSDIPGIAMTLVPILCSPSCSAISLVSPWHWFPYYVPRHVQRYPWYRHDPGSHIMFPVMFSDIPGIAMTLVHILCSPSCSAISLVLPWPWFPYYVPRHVQRYSWYRHDTGSHIMFPSCSAISLVSFSFFRVVVKRPLINSKSNRS
jgi:hypothetical protein